MSETAGRGVSTTSRPVSQSSSTALVLGLVSVLSAWLVIGIVVGIAAVIVGWRVQPRNGVARAGAVLGWVGIALTIVFAAVRSVTST